MKFNLTPLECILFIFVCLGTYILTKHGRGIRRWWHDFFRKRRGPRRLKSKSPDDCPQCNRDICLLPHRPKLDVLPWPERKSRRGRPKTIDTSGHACLNPLCAYFAIADPAIHALVSNGRRGMQRILYFKCQACGGCRTSRFGTPLYWLKTPLARIAMVMTAMSEGVDISAAGRIFGHHHTTITRWIERCGHHSERLHQRLFHRALSVGHLQLDKLVTKVKQDAKRIWVWTAVAAQSKLILALHIGRRSSADAHQLLHQVWQRLSPHSFTSDGLKPFRLLKAAGRQEETKIGQRLPLPLPDLREITGFASPKRLDLSCFYLSIIFSGTTASGSTRPQTGYWLTVIFSVGTILASCPSGPQTERS